MFDIGLSELLVIAVVAIVVVGPKDLPRLLRTFGHYAGKLRRAASDFQGQFEEAMRQSEVDEVRNAIESVRENTPLLDLKAPTDQPAMLPKPPGQSPPAPRSAGAAATEIDSKPKSSPRKKRASAKPNPPRAARPKKIAEPGQ
jgi:sec-independent protein translocase protein TatB